MFKKIINFWAAHQKLVFLLFLALLLCYPAIFGSYYLRNIAIQCLLYSVLSLALNLIMGFTGIVVLGMAAFYGIGAYALAILTTKVGLPYLPAVVAAIAIAFAAGALLALPTLRIQGNYLAIVKIGRAHV